MKPHVAIPFLLWALFSRRFKTAGIALLVASAGFAAFAMRAHADPTAIIRNYAGVIGTYFGREPVLVGLAELRPLFHLGISNHDIADAAFVGCAGLMFGVICAIGVTEGRRQQVLISAPVMTGVWSLLSFYHLTYGFILLLPAAALLVVAEDPSTLWLRRRLFWPMQIALMIDVPGVAARLHGFLSLPRDGWLPLEHFDRVMMILIFGGLSVLWFRSGTGVTGETTRT